MSPKHPPPANKQVKTLCDCLCMGAMAKGPYPCPPLAPPSHFSTEQRDKSSRISPPSTYSVLVSESSSLEAHRLLDWDLDVVALARGEKDVLDETYWDLAGKLDASDFHLTISSTPQCALGNLNVVHSELAVDRRVNQDAVRAELYELNAYGTPSRELISGSARS